MKINVIKRLIKIVNLRTNVRVRIDRYENKEKLLSKIITIRFSEIRKRFLFTIAERYIKKLNFGLNTTYKPTVFNNRVVGESNIGIYDNAKDQYLELQNRFLKEMKK